MHLFEELTEDNFLMYAMKVYDNPQCRGIEEFRSDLNHIKYLKRLFKRYQETKDLSALRVRLVLNHLIVFYNVFQPDGATRILFYKIEPEFWAILKTFLTFLGYMPDRIKGLKQLILDTEIPLDLEIMYELQKI